MIELIQPLLAPAVMISAGALVCLAQFTRFSSVVAQLRDLLRESRSTLRAASEREPQQREGLLDQARSLEHQADQLMAHAATLRNALRFLVFGVFLMALCSLAIGASSVIPSFSVMAIGLFVSGCVSTLVGLILVLAELHVSLEAVTYEHANVNRLRREAGPASAGDVRVGG